MGSGGLGGRNRDSWRMGGAEGRSVAGHGGPQLVCMQMGSSSEFEGLAGDPVRGALEVSPATAHHAPAKEWLDRVSSGLASCLRGLASDFPAATSQPSFVGEKKRRSTWGFGGTARLGGPPTALAVQIVMLANRFSPTERGELSR